MIVFTVHVRSSLLTRHAALQHQTAYKTIHGLLILTYDGFDMYMGLCVDTYSA